MATVTMLKPVGVSLIALRKRVAPVALSVLGLASLTAAAFQAGLWEGLTAAGVACFVLEWRVSGE